MFWDWPLVALNPAVFADIMNMKICEISSFVLIYTFVKCRGKDASSHFVS